MARPPTPGEMAVVDQIHADASGFIDSMLTTAVTELQSGRPALELFTTLGGGLVRTEQEKGPIGLVQYRVLLAVAVSRLARMHHAAEQIAGKWETEATPSPGQSEPDTGQEIQLDCAQELRKLVDDHG